MLLFLSRQEILANSLTQNLIRREYTKEYKEYLQLTEEERQKVLPPRMFEVEESTKEIKNPLRLARSVGNALTPKFSLKDVIGENVVAKNQGVTNSCWCFATMSSLETNLALTEDKEKVYDFSEKHMNYATSQSFLNDAKNEKGFNRQVKDGGNWWSVVPYLTNGAGAIKESDMPFENNEDNIDISTIQNKEVVSQVYDTKTFPSYEVTQVTQEIKQTIKDHIKTYGSVFAQIHGANILSDYYNQETGAIYCDNKENCPTDHAISIIGWDDDYAIENFNQKHQPKNKGAWIIRNSWGEQVGKQGLMYISYEDINIYTNMNGIVKASSSKNYENIYQYDDFGASQVLTVQSSKIYIANLFDKKTQGKEYLTQVAIDVPDKSTCKVFINPKNDNKAKSNLQPITLKEGDTKTIEAGYHTLEFAKAIEITGNQFVVVIEIQGTRENQTSFSTEAKLSDSKNEEMKKITIFDNVKVESGKCFYTDAKMIESNVWQDLSKFSSESNQILNSDTTIKAFTVSKSDNVQENPSEEETPKDEQKGQNSNFDYAKSELKKVKIDTSTQSATMEIEVNGVIRNEKQEDCEYYYYLAPNKTQQNIQNWTKITEKQNDRNKLSFTIDLKDLQSDFENYQDLYETENVYLYIKEIAKDGESESVKISDPMLLEPKDDTEIYIDNVKIDFSNSGNIENKPFDNSITSSTKDDTVAKKILPNTGMQTLFIFMVMLAIIGVGVYKYMRYKNLSKYIK